MRTGKNALRIEGMNACLFVKVVVLFYFNSLYSIVMYLVVTSQELFRQHSRTLHMGLPSTPPR
jgi:hypothetical protein